MPDYKTLRGTSTFTYEEKRSRFIASVGHTPDVEEAKAFIEQIKAEFEDARHNCWAYCAGAAGSTDRIGASDDGEPHGTAGRPMLTAVTHSGIGEVTVVVTRYFGGILLGIIEIFSKSYISTALSDAIVFAVLIVVLLVKPTGILGKKIMEKV